MCFYSNYSDVSLHGFNKLVPLLLSVPGAFFDILIFVKPYDIEVRTFKNAVLNVFSIILGDNIYDMYVYRYLLSINIYRLLIF